jgi:hypothetical protein
VARQQNQLAQVFDLGGLALQNFNAAIDPNGPGGPALRARYDPQGNSAGFVAQICGNEYIRALRAAISSGHDSTLDLICAASSALATLPSPPNASAGPNLSLSALVP